MTQRNDVARAITDSFFSIDELSQNLETANVVDGLFEIARAIRYLADKNDNRDNLTVEAKP